MNSPSSFLVWSFTLLALLVGARATRAVGGRAAWTVASLWLVATGGLAWSGVLAQFETFPPPLLKVIVPGLLVTALVCSSSWARARLEGWSLTALIAFQAFRLPLELLMHEAYREGVMPGQMTFTGRNLDIITGLLAIPLAYRLARGHQDTAMIWTWNALGLGLLVNVVSVAVLSMPGPMRLFVHEPPNLWVATFPFIWLPTVMVPLALAGHLLVTRKLLTKAQGLSSST